MSSTEEIELVSEQETLSGAVKATGKKFGRFIAGNKDAKVFRDVHRHVLTQQEQANARIKLETLTRSTVTIMLIALFACSIICISWSITNAIGFSLYDSINSHLIIGFSYADSGIFVIAVLIMLFLVISFPLRILFHSANHNIVPLQEQTLLALLLITYLICPATSVYNVVRLFSGARNSFKIQSYSGSLQIVNSVFEIVAIAMFFVYIAMSTIALSTDDTDEDKTAVPNEEIEETTVSVAAVATPTVSIPPTINENKQLDPAQAFLSAVRQVSKRRNSERKASKKRKRTCCGYLTICVNVILKGFGRLNSASKGAMIIIVLYFCTAIGLALGLAFLPSVIPFMGLITVLKVCLTPPPLLFAQMPGMSQNCTYIGPNSFCPAGSRPFWRAMAVVGLSFLELLVCVYLKLLTTTAKNRLAHLPYAKCRSKHLTFRFFVWSKHIIVLSVFVCGILQTAIPNPYMWIYSDTTVAYYTPECITIPCQCEATSIDPLGAVGIPTNSQFFPIIYLNLIVWIACLAMAFLPPNSRGVIGWFWGSEVIEDDPYSREMYFISEGQAQNYLFDENREPNVNGSHRSVKHLSREASSQAASAGSASTLGEVIENAARPWHKIMKRLRRKRQNAPDVQRDCKTLLEMWAYSRSIFILELACLTFNFTSVAYEIPEVAIAVEDRRNKLAKERRKSVNSKKDKDDPSLLKFEIAGKVMEVKIDDSSTRASVATDQAMFDVQKAMVQDPKYEYHKHIWDRDTDTHLIIASSNDRIVIAFRGTVSATNVGTDIDFTLVPHLDAHDVPGSYHGEAKVHQGIYKAYQAIQLVLWENIQQLTEHGPKKPRLLLITGHSLGGALATLCAFDFALYQNNLVNTLGVACITFAQPKVGNPSFCQRYDHLVPCTKRFAVNNDTIPKLPPRGFGDHYQHCGTEILLDLHGNLIVNPNAIERMVQRGFAGLSTSNHYRGSYHLSLILWCARTHYEEWVPDWWVIVVDHLFLWYPNRVRALNPETKMKIHEQLNLEGATFFVGETTCRHRSTQTGGETEPDITTPLNRDRFYREASRSLEVMFGLDERAHVEEILERADIGDPQQQTKIARTLLENGFTTDMSLQMLSHHTLHKLGVKSASKRNKILTAIAETIPDEPDDEFYIAESKSISTVPAEEEEDTIPTEEDALLEPIHIDTPLNPPDERELQSALHASASVEIQIIDDHDSDKDTIGDSSSEHDDHTTGI